ncbi:RNA ligase (ATP) [Burkholderia gladioli]|uniref:RNA ligase (ATP) n=1 Tax=Burkholderia gladioli TaxID=28095 RepID=UPI003B50998D
MSQFEVPVVRVKIEPHPDADRLELAIVGDFRSIVAKGQFKDGDLAVYIPEQAVLPGWLIEQLNLTGKLAGGAKNRVKAVRLRGIFSQGICLSGNTGDELNPTTIGVSAARGNDLCPVFESQVFTEGDNVAEFLDITKYEPSVPAHMAGRALGADLSITHKYDFENLKKHPNLFDDGDEVVITEKVHGTLLQVIVVPESAANEKFYKGRVAITSKGLGGRGIILDHNDDANVYAQCVAKHGILDKMLERFGGGANLLDLPVLMFGEVFGSGIQDLSYGSTLEFRAFDLCVGVREKAEFYDWMSFDAHMNAMGIQRVPALYVGPYSKDVVLQHTDGKTTIGGDHIREGVVVKSVYELRHSRYGRKIAKSVSEAYLLRKNATEFA